MAIFCRFVLPADAGTHRRGGPGRLILPRLKEAGQEVDYEEFAGGHEVPDRINRRFLESLAAPAKP